MLLMDDYRPTSVPPVNLSSSAAVDTVQRSSATDAREACVLFRIVFNSGLIGVICFLGLAGNILSLAILHSDRQNRVASFLLQALAVADTAVLVISWFVLSIVYGILHSQTTVVNEWMDFIFKYVNSLGYMTQGVTIWLTVLLAINRYIAVCRPLHANRLGLRGAKIQVCAVVIVSFVSNVPRIILRDMSSSSSSSSPSITSNDVVNMSALALATTPRDRNSSSSHAPSSSSSSYSSQSPIMLFEILYTTLILILPLVILAGLNLRLIAELQGAKRRLRHFSRKYSGSNEDNITVVMVVVIIVVVICHTPDRTIQILRWIPLTESRTCPNWMYFSVSVSNLLIVINSSINFLVYCVLRKRFRRILFLKVCHRRRAKASPARTANHHCGRLLWSQQYGSKNSDGVEMNDAETGAAGGSGGSERSRNKMIFEMHSRRPERQTRLHDNRYSFIV